MNALRADQVVGNGHNDYAEFVEPTEPAISSATTGDRAMQDAMFNACSRFREQMVGEYCKTPDDVMLLANYLIIQAAYIYEKVGGPVMAAQQFTAVAAKAANR